MEHIQMKAKAKINIALDITGKRADGYHEIKSVMQTLALHDVVYIKKVRKPNYLKLNCNKEWLPTDERNLAYRAAEFMLKEFRLDTGVYVELEKNIPVAAGLGGGSSDCAAVLMGMRNLFGLPISLERLAEIGLRFGADVPFCVVRGTVLAEGIGEKLTPLPPFPPIRVLLAKPPGSVSTRDIFEEFSLENHNGRVDFVKLIEGIKNKDLSGVCLQMKNALESVTISKIGVIADLKRAMTDNGAAGSLMSGSGPTVFGLFRRKEDVEAAINAIKRDFPEVRELITTKTSFRPVLCSKFL